MSIQLRLMQLEESAMILGKQLSAVPGTLMLQEDGSTLCEMIYNVCKIMEDIANQTGAE